MLNRKARTLKGRLKQAEAERILGFRAYNTPCDAFSRRSFSRIPSVPRPRPLLHTPFTRPRRTVAAAAAARSRAWRGKRGLDMRRRGARGRGPQKERLRSEPGCELYARDTFARRWRFDLTGAVLKHPESGTFVSAVACGRTGRPTLSARRPRRATGGRHIFFETHASRLLTNVARLEY